MKIPWARRLDLYPKQHDAIYSPDGDAVIEASPKAGKTIGALQWLLDEIEDIGEAHRRFLWVAPVYSQAKIAFGRAYNEVLMRDAIGVHKTDHTITFETGEVLVFGSADRPDNIYGEDYWAVVMDETSRHSEDAWIATQSTLNHTNGRIRQIGNPPRQGHWWHRHIKKVKQGMPGWSYTKLTQQDAIDAGVVTADADTRAQDRLDPSLYRWLYLLEEVADNAIRILTENLRRSDPPDLAMAARGWDMASTAGGDFTVGGRIAANHDGYWITDIAREQRASDDVMDMVRVAAATDGPAVDQVVEEEKGASGSLFVSSVRRELDRVPVGTGQVFSAPVEQNKIIRAWPMVVAIRAGRYHLALPAEQEVELLDEMGDWPNSSYDDQVDALAHAHNHLAERVEGMVGSGWVPGAA